MNTTLSAQYARLMDAYEKLNTALSREQKRRREAERHVQALCRAAGHPTQHPTKVVKILKKERI